MEYPIKKFKKGVGMRNNCKNCFIIKKTCKDAVRGKAIKLEKICNCCGKKFVVTCDGGKFPRILEDKTKMINNIEKNINFADKDFTALFNFGECATIEVNISNYDEFIKNNEAKFIEYLRDILINEYGYPHDIIFVNSDSEKVCGRFSPEPEMKLFIFGKKTK